MDYQKHYEAHEMLCLAIDNYSVYKALTTTREQNRFGEISESELYGELKEKAHQGHSDYQNEIITVDGIEMKRSVYNMRNFSKDVTKEIIVDGEKTTKAKVIGKKSMETLKNEYVEYEGKMITKLELRVINRAESARKNGKWYNLYNGNKELIGKFPAVEIRNDWYKALEKTSEDKPLGHNKRYLFKIVKTEYIGWYVELIK